MSDETSSKELSVKLGKRSRKELAKADVSNSQIFEVNNHDNQAYPFIYLERNLAGSEQTRDIIAQSNSLLQSEVVGWKAYLFSLIDNLQG